MTTTIYNDLLTTGANMSVLNENAQGVEFSGLTGGFFFEQYDAVNNFGSSALTISGHKTISILATKWIFNDSGSVILTNIGWYNKDLETLIAVTESTLVYLPSDTISDVKNMYEGDDTIVGNKYNDILRGGNGNDNLLGNAGNDKLMGDAGNDCLEGGAGNDTLIGGAGRDMLRGNSGADTFKFESLSHTSKNPDSADMIVDFNAKQKDKIDLSSIDAISSTAADDKFTFIGKTDFTGAAGQLNYKVEPLYTPNFGSTSQMVVYGDVDGDKVADFGIIVLPTDVWGSTTLLATNFLL